MTTTNNMSPTLSLAGTWQPVSNQYFTSTYQGQLANTYDAQIALGAAGLNGLVLAGWAEDPGSTTLIPVNAAILEQQSDGTMTLATSKYISDTQTNGVGRLLVTDLNGDGKPDIVMLAYNETPVIAENSTVLMSNADGTYSNVTINDPGRLAGGAIASINGVLTIFGVGDTIPTYTWNGSAFTVSHSLQPGYATQPNVNGEDMVVADFNGDGQLEVVYGNSTYGPGYQYSSSNTADILLYHLQNGGPTGSPVYLTPYFNGKALYAGYTSSVGGSNPTETYQMWVDDFNHDGKPDILTAADIWNANTGGTKFTMLQMFQNNGNLSFTDKSDTLNPDYNKRAELTDFSMQLIDIDHSGIKTYMGSVQSYSTDLSFQNNFVMVNDGTGHLYYALHDEFQSWGQQANAYVKSLAPGNETGAGVPKFVAYVDAKGLLNFEAMVIYGDYNSANRGTNAYGANKIALVNFPTEINIYTYVTTPMTLTDRNGSHLIRTFAGNDVIYSGSDGGYSHVDGGLGFNEVVYAGAEANYTITKQSDGSWVVKDNVGSDGTDTLVNIQRLKFTDQSMDLGSYLTAGSALAEAKAGTLAARAVITDSGADVGHNLDAVQALAAAGKLSSITLTDPGVVPVVPLSLSQMTADSAVLALISGKYNLAIADGAAAISAQIDTLETLVAKGTVTSIALTDSGTPNLTVTAAQFAADSTVLTDISGAHSLTVQLSGNAAQHDFSADHWSGANALQFADQTVIVAATPGPSNAVTTGNVTELYSAVLAREPDIGGLAFYQSFLKSNPTTPLQQFAEWFLSSSEYISAHNYAQTQVGDTQFITDSYQNLLHRTASASEISFYENNVLAPAVAGLIAGSQAYANAQLQAHALMLVYFSASTEFLGDVQITATNSASAQHWLLLT